MQLLLLPFFLFPLFLFFSSLLLLLLSPPFFFHSPLLILLPSPFFYDPDLLLLSLPLLSLDFHPSELLLLEFLLPKELLPPPFLLLEGHPDPSGLVLHVDWPVQLLAGVHRHCVEQSRTGLHLVGAGGLVGGRARHVPALLSFGVLFQRRDYGLGNVVGEPLQLSVDVSRGLRGGLYPLLHDVLLVLLGQKVDRLLGELAPGVAAARGRGEGFLRPRVLVAPAGRWGRLWGLRSHGSFLIVPAQIHFSPFHGRGFGRQVIHRSMDSFLPVERVHSTNVRKPSGVDVGA